MDRNKIIIENRTELPLLKVMWYVEAVMKEGLISNDGKQYCYMTTFRDGICVSTDLNKKSHRFVVWYDERYVERKTNG